MRFSMPFLASLGGVITAAALIALGVPPMLVALLGVCFALVGGFWLKRRPRGFDIPLFASETLRTLDRDLGALKLNNDREVAHYVELAHGSPSLAQYGGMPYALRLSEAADYVAKNRVVVASYLDRTANLPEQKDADEATRQEILSLGLPEAIIQAEFDKLDKFDALIGEGCAAFAREMWDGAMRIGRVILGPDVIDAVLAQHKSRAS